MGQMPALGWLRSHVRVSYLKGRSPRARRHIVRTRDSDRQHQGLFPWSISATTTPHRPRRVSL